MELALAIYQIDPTAAYLLNADKSAILEWRGPGAQPTQQQLSDAWTAYQAAQTAKANNEAAARTAKSAALVIARDASKPVAARITAMLDALGL